MDAGDHGAGDIQRPAARVRLNPPAGQGGPDQRRFDRRHVRGPRLGLPGRPPRRAARLHRDRSAGADRAHPGARRAVRPGHRLRSVPALAGSRTVGCHRRQHRRGRDRAAAHRADHHRRRRPADRRHGRLCHRPDRGHQADRRRHGRRHLPGRDADPRAARAGHHAAARPLELVGAGPAGPAAPPGGPGTIGRRRTGPAACAGRLRQHGHGLDPTVQIRRIRSICHDFSLAACCAQARYATPCPITLGGPGPARVGAALMSPAALSTVMTLFTGSDRGKALGVWSALSGAGSALGVILGGVLTSEAGWRWVFAINVPIGVALLIAIPLAAPARQRPGAVERGLDIPGAVLVTVGTGAAIYGLINVGSHGWSAASTVLPLVLAAAIWAFLAVLERRVRRPLLTVGLLGRRAVLAGSFLMLAATGLMVGGFFLGSFALQHAHNYSALHVGLAFLPIAVATVAGAQAGSRMLTRVSARVVAVTGLALAAAGYAIAARWTQPAVMVTGLSIATLGIGATFVTAFTASLTDAGSAQAGLRSALVNTFHELGGAAGVAVLSSAAGAGLVTAHLSRDR